MLLRELFDINEKMAWAKRGNKVVRKYRCSTGTRAGRIVSNIGQCFAAPDVKKRARLKLTKARLGSRITRKANKTKRVNPASKRVKAMNR